MTDTNQSPSSEAKDDTSRDPSGESSAEDLSDIDSERPPGDHDTEELSVDQLQELLKKSAQVK